MQTKLCDQAEQLLSIELESSKQLQGLLKKEQKAITALEQQTMIEIVEHKQALIESMNRFHQYVEDFISQSLGLNGSYSDLGKWINTQHGEAKYKLNGIWQSLLAILKDNHHLNTLNGQLLNRQQQKNRILIDLFRGGKPQPNLYQADGTSGHLAHQVSFGKA